MMRLQTTLRVVAVLLFAGVILGSVLPLHAQWSEEDGGVYVGHQAFGVFNILPDGNAGAWIVREYDGIWLQRVDSDGYLQFPGEGISVGAPGDHGLLGMAPSDSGSVIVAYMTLDDNEDDWHIQAQRFRPDGSQVWDTLGVDLLWPNPHVARLMGRNRKIISDGSGGAWVVYDGRDILDFRACGVNSDGSAKVNTGIHLASQVSSDMCFEPDGNGGVFLVYEASGLYITTKCQHLFEDGTIQFGNDGLQICDRPVGSSYYYYNILPDGEGGLFVGFSCGTVICQHVAADGTLPLGLRGSEVFPAPSNEATTGDIVEFTDSSLAMPVTRNNDTISLFRMNRDGTPYFDQYESVIDSVDEYNIGIDPILIKVSNDEFISFHYLRYFVGNYETHSLVKCIKIDTTAHNVWNEPLLVTHDVLSVYFMKAVPSPEDSSAILEVSKGSGGMFEIWLYKVFSSGYLAGRDDGGVQERNVVPDSPGILQAYPSPFNSTLHLEFQVAESGSYEIEISNILGQLVTVIPLHLMANKLYTQSYSFMQEASGAYFVRLKSSDTTQQLTVKVVFER